MRMAICPLVAAALLATGCNVLPRDAAGTSKRIAQAGVLRVGVAPSAASRPEVARLLKSLNSATGASLRIHTADGEPLLRDVEAGRLDLGVAWLDEETPWADRVALAPPLARARQGEAVLELRAVARNGENRWIMLVERDSRAASSAAP